MERALQLLLGEDPRQPVERLRMRLETLQRHTVEVAGQELELMSQPEPLHPLILHQVGVPIRSQKPEISSPAQSPLLS